MVVMETGRLVVSKEALHEAFNRLHMNMQAARKKHGHGAFASPNEAHGSLRSEYKEAEEEFASRDTKRIREELMDIATVCLWAEASYQQLDRQAAQILAENRKVDPAR